MQSYNVITDLSSLGLLSVNGQDAQKLLQGQLTCDLAEISANQTRFAAHCNPQGRIIALSRLMWLQDQYLLQMPKNLVPVAMNALKKYAVFFKVQLQDVSEHYKQFGYYGEKLEEFVLPQQLDEAVTVDNVLIIKVSDTAPRYIILGPRDAVTPLWEKLSAQTNTIALDEWKHLDIKEGIPAIYPETSETFLPHDINLPKLNGVNFKKGCYTGQEIIARMEYRGKPKNHLFRAQAQSSQSPHRGSDIFCKNTPFGSIVDYCQVGYNTYELLVTGAQSDAPLSLDREQTIILNIL